MKSTRQKIEELNQESLVSDVITKECMERNDGRI
jgi:hypothetical protein